MNEFDIKAREWDSNPGHVERALVIAKKFLQMVPVKTGMTAMEYGAGTALMSFALAEHFSKITLMDNSKEMVKVMKEKVVSSGLSHLKPLYLDLEKEEYSAETYDCIYSQMVLHHVHDTKKIVHAFFNLLNPGGYLAIADLYAEDGSFHGEGFNGHNGFDVDELQKLIKAAGYKHLDTQPCYVRKKMIGESLRGFPLFLMIARKPL